MAASPSASTPSSKTSPSTKNSSSCLPSQKLPIPDSHFHELPFCHYSKTKTRCHPERRELCAPKDLNVNYALDVWLEILRLSLSHSLRMTRRRRRFYFG